MDFGSSVFYSRQDRNYSFPNISLSMTCHDEPLSEVQFKSYKTRLQEYKNYLDSVNRLANCVNVCITEEPVSIGESGLLTGEALNALQHAGSISVYNFFQQHNWEYPSNPEGEMAVVRPHNPVTDEFLDSEQPIRPDWPSVHLTKCFVDQDKAKLHGSALPLRNYLPPTISFRNAADVDDAIEPEPRPSKQMLSQEGDFEIVSTEQGIMVQKYVKEGKEAELIPLYDYYYGRIEGRQFNPVNKGEYRFSCAACQITLYSNVSAIEHILSHTDERIMKLFKTSDVIQCQTCGKMLGNAFELRNHMEAEHMTVIGPDGEQRVYIDTNYGNIICTISCRICEKTCDSNFTLAYHLQNSHRENEMPYRCGICNFHTSLYQDVIDHFKKTHCDTNELICPYCLRIFVINDAIPMNINEPPSIVTGVGQTSLFLQHLKTHKELLFKHCTGCTLNFINKTDFELHRRLDHKTQVVKSELYPDYKTPAIEPVPETRVVDVVRNSPLPMTTTTTTSNNINSNNAPLVKRMNAPEPSRVKDLSNLVFPDELDMLQCIECGDSLALEKHRRYLPCSLCRFASCCGDAFHRHVLKVHTNSQDDGNEKSSTLIVPFYDSLQVNDVRAEDYYCSKCAITNLDGNTLTSHLVDECGVSMVTLRPDPQLLSARKQAEREHETLMIGVEDNHLSNEIGSKSIMMVNNNREQLESSSTNNISNLMMMNRPSKIINDEESYQDKEMNDMVMIGDEMSQAHHQQMMIVDESDTMDQQMVDDSNTHTISIPEGITLKPGESLVLLICENNSEEFIIINTADINTPEMQEFFINRRSQNIYVVQSNDELPE